MNDEFDIDYAGFHARNVEHGRRHIAAIEAIQETFRSLTGQHLELYQVAMLHEEGAGYVSQPYLSPLEASPEGRAYLKRLPQHINELVEFSRRTLGYTPQSQKYFDLR